MAEQPVEIKAIGLNTKFVASIAERDVDFVAPCVRLVVASK